MIPTNNNLLQSNIIVATKPTKTFKMNPETNRIIGWIDKVEAVKQAIYIILNVERYQYLIHSWNFGVELMGLFGQPISFVLPELKRRITEALLQDDRITAVGNFEFEVNGKQIHATFTVSTIYGDVETEKVVEI